MAFFLDSADLAAATNTTLRQITAGMNKTTTSVNFCNRSSAPVPVRFAVASTATPTAAEWLIYDVVVPGNGSLERSGVPTPAGKYIVMYASAAGVSGQCYGSEE